MQLNPKNIKYNQVIDNIASKGSRMSYGGGRDAGGDGGGGTQLNPCGQYHEFGKCNTNNATFHNCPLTRQERGGMCFHKNMF